MKRKILTVVFDSKAECYQHVQLFLTKADAMRSFAAAVNNPDTIFNQHPADFTLFEIAEFDDQTGAVCPNATKINLAMALDVLKPAQNNLPMFPKTDAVQPLQASH